VIDALAYLIIGAALLLALWGGVEALRNRPPNRALYSGAALVGGLMAMQAVIAAVRLAGADTRTGLFIGYVLTAILLIPAAVALARMEPTRWGSALLGAAGLVLAPLVVRLLQIWSHGG
jgi:hypothetical protein